MRTARLDKICGILDGSTSDLDEVLEMEGLFFESLSIEEHLYIDSKVKCCDTCGYWIHSKEVDDYGTCNECNESARENTL